jgi:ABC-2 type transport system ATP-binding protein
MTSSAAISIKNLSKTYPDGNVTALDNINLTIKEGEIFGLLGPNGAGKTTLINIIAGLSKATSGTITVFGKDVVKDYQHTRNMIGLVPQEVNADSFFSIYNSVRFQQGFFNRKYNPSDIEKTLKQVDLWEKRDATGFHLSGGMKRRLMVAKALIHKPKIVFLDEPTAGVDVELRKKLWDTIRELNRNNITIILTTHYIHEAEELADRIGIINHGKIIKVDDKRNLMKELGQDRLLIGLDKKLTALPKKLKQPHLHLSEDKKTIILDKDRFTGNLDELLATIKSTHLRITDISTKSRSLEEIFVELIHDKTS